MAIVLALIAAGLLTALGVGLVTAGQVESTIADNHRAGSETLYAADAAAELAVYELGQLPRWDDVLSGAVRTSFVDATVTPTLPSNERIDLVAMTAALQREADSAPFGLNNAVWRLVAYGPISRLMASVGSRSPAYVAVWAADDPSDADDNPVVDANGVISVLALAMGRASSRRSVEMRLARLGAGRVGARVLSWRERQ
jgi:hypothetical protein